MKWTFKDFSDVPYKQICEGYTCLDIIAGVCDIDPDDTERQALAEKNGGKLAPKPKKKVSK